MAFEWAVYALLGFAAVTIGLLGWVAFVLASQRAIFGMLAEELIHRFDDIARNADALRRSMTESLGRVIEQVAEADSHASEQRRSMTESLGRVIERVAEAESRAAKQLEASLQVFGDQHRERLPETSEVVRELGNRIVGDLAGFVRPLETAEQSLSEIIQRTINIESKTNMVLEYNKTLNQFSGHADQAFGHLSYSQHGEDLIIANVFHIIGDSEPSFLDIGAHHPLNISNTALLYERGSRGINVEANPNLIDAFLERRPRDVTVNIGVGAQRGNREFYLIDKWSGRNTFDKETAEKFVQENPEFEIKETIEIEIITINDLVDRYSNGIFPDFMNLDVEGLECDILASADFTRSRPKVICAEAISGGNRDRSVRLLELLVLKGYKPYAKTLGNIIFLTDEAHRQLWR